MKNREKLAAIKDGYMKWLDAVKNSMLYSVLYKKGVLYFVISFLIPASIMLYAFKGAQIHPFGDNQMLVVDLWHQYFPFFRVVREKLLEGDSFLYSWQNGMGTNFLSLISYYAASPLNWIAAFFGDDSVRDALTYILIAKIGFCGAFFSCFLRYTFKRTDFSICIFSSMFALCSYILGYYWNVMWFDTIALFPLVMLGVVAICREKKWRTFTISLALSLISNYYVGYFTCIFTIFMFAAAVIIYAESIKDFFVKLWIIARSSILGIALAGFMLLPAYYGLQLTYSANNTFPHDVYYYESWTDIFANLISYSAPAMKEGLPNFACGMLALVLFGVFLYSGGIKVREKISALLMLALIAVSCNMNKLNFIWHGFHFTNMIPYRFAFIFSFVLIAAAYRAYDIILKNGVKLYQLFLMVMFPGAVFALNYYKAISSEEGVFTLTDSLKSSLIICAAFLLIFIAVRVFPFKSPKVRNTVVSLFVGAAVVSECVSNASLGVKTVGTSDYKSYPTKNSEIQTLLSIAEENESSLFYRTEVTGTYTLNDSALYVYNGISQFSSSANVSVTRFMRSLGLYASEAGNRYYYRTSTPVVNSLLGVKYLISKNGHLSSGEFDLTHYSEEGTVHMYENNYPLSLGFMINEKALYIENKTSDNPFEYQNRILRLAAGINKNCYTPQPVKLVEYNGMEVTKKSYGHYTFRREKNNANSVYHFDGVEGSYLYGYATNGGCEKVSVRSEGVNVDSDIKIDDYPIVFPLGNAQEGETAEVTITAKNDVETGSYNLMIYAMDCEVFEEAYNKLADEQLEITEFTDTEIKGTINALEGGIMYLSIPYEKGWTAYVDGEKAETCKVFGAMTGVKVSAGEHDIRLVYVPEGFAEGAAASGVSLMLCGVIAYFDRRKARKLAAEPESNHVEITTDMDEVTAPELHDEEAESEPFKKSEEEDKNEKS